MNYREGCGIFFSILIWWGAWELLGLCSSKLIKNKIMEPFTIYSLSIILGLFFVYYIELDI